jgi:hypothetical protein
VEASSFLRQSQSLGISFEETEAQTLFELRHAPRERRLRLATGPARPSEVPVGGDQTEIC